MAIGNLILGGIAGAAKAFSAYKTAAEKKNATPVPAVQNTVNTPAYNNKSVYDNIYSSTKGDVGTSLTNAINTGASVDTVKKIYQDRLSKATGTQYENDSIMKNALNYINSQAVLPVVENPYEARMKQLESKYANLNGQIANANNAAVEQGVDRLNSQKSTINQGFDDSARQAYITSMQSKNALPQQLAVQGVNGGASETAMLGLNTNYENNLNSINTNRQNSLLGIDNAVLDLKNSGELSTAEQTLQNNQAALTAYQNMLNNSASYNQWQTNFNADRSDTEYNQNYQENRDTINDSNYNNETATVAKQTEYNNILNRLEMGLISANDAVALGIPAAEVQSFVDRIKATQNADLANTKSLINNRNESSTTSETETSPLTTADKYLAQGNREKAISALTAIYSNTQIKQYLESKGYRTDDIDWGPKAATETSSRYENPVTSIGNIVNFYKNKGYTSEQIASILNK